ncbi:MAG: competence/damage-inducible protein A [Acidobacteria bacterium]|nr:competence/damage-inducible protein A [Acidobacteriota bacterium]MBI3427943.1 competence/damage-inducible protein A [Acidobacteriota bacterium]
MLNAEILAIGSEMLTPFRVDTNSLWLTEQLNALGVEVKLKTVVGDDELRLEEAIRDALRRSEIIISTGGLGPTEDDITKKVFARVLGRALEIHEPSLERIKTRFARRNIEMTPNNVRQAMALAGGQVLPNEHGSAPGQLIEQGNCTVALLPGPPREMKPMFAEQVAPVLKQRVGDVYILRHKLSIYGLTESKCDALAAPVYTRYTNPATTILFKDGQLELHLTAQARAAAAAASLLAELAAKLRDVLGDYVYSEEDEPLEKVVGDLLRINHATLATAESCTGGLLAGRLTEVAGSSDYFIEGVVSYANAAKIDLLGVPRELIEQHGAVSEPVAEAMAAGIRARAGTTLGIGITGIAGPGGGSEEKPVGLVYIALADANESKARRLVFPGDRQFIRSLAVNAALDIVRRRLK